MWQDAEEIHFAIFRSGISLLPLGSTSEPIGRIAETGSEIRESGPVRVSERARARAARSRGIEKIRSRAALARLRVRSVDRSIDLTRISGEPAGRTLIIARYFSFSSRGGRANSHRVAKNAFPAPRLYALNGTRSKRPKHSWRWDGGEREKRFRREPGGTGMARA